MAEARTKQAKGGTKKCHNLDDGQRHNQAFATTTAVF